MSPSGSELPWICIERCCCGPIDRGSGDSGLKQQDASSRVSAARRLNSSIGIAHAAAQGGGVALLPVALFLERPSRKRLVRPFGTEIHLGSYWLTWLKSKRVTPAMQAFREWLLNETKEGSALRGKSFRRS